MRLKKEDLARWFQRPSRPVQASNESFMPANALDLVEFFELPPFAENRILQLTPKKFDFIDALRIQLLHRHPLHGPHKPVLAERLRYIEMAMFELGYSDLEIKNHRSFLTKKHEISEPAPS